MTVTAEQLRLRVRLEHDCAGPRCSAFALDLYRLLKTPQYLRGASVLPLPPTWDDWKAGHRTARKRAARAGRLGYRFAEIDRSQYADDIYEINVSLPERQGRPMAAGYLQRHQYSPLPAYTCDLHRIREYGVLAGDRLVAYLVLYRSGELALISQILGHGDTLADDVMYLLGAGAIRAQFAHGGVVYYNRHDSGTDGLRYYKERLGFRPADITLAL